MVTGEVIAPSVIIVLLQSLSTEALDASELSSGQVCA